MCATIRWNCFNEYIIALSYDFFTRYNTVSWWTNLTEHYSKITTLRICLQITVVWKNLLVVLIRNFIERSIYPITIIVANLNICLNYDFAQFIRVTVYFIVRSKLQSYYSPSPSRHYLVLFTFVLFVFKTEIYYAFCWRVLDRVKV